MADETTTPSGSRWRLVAAAAIVVVLLACGGFLLGRFSAPSAVAAPTTDSAAAGFLRDMQVHHAQAVAMSFTVRERLSPDDAAYDDVRLIAYDIANGQGNQAGQMFGLLQAWGLPQASPVPQMSWMGDDHMSMGSGGGAGAGDAMPGMASAADLDRLATASGVDAERLYLTLMIAHHRGGVEMAEAILTRTDVPQVLAMATNMKRSQTSEIGAMQDMLDELPAG